MAKPISIINELKPITTSSKNSRPATRNIDKTPVQTPESSTQNYHGTGRKGKEG